MEKDVAKPRDTPPETDWRDQGGWRHPYMLYIIGTTALFLLLIGIGWVAFESGLIPTR